MTTPIRNATREDAPFLAEIVQLAARSHVAKGLWDIALPDSEPSARLHAIEATLTTDEPSWCHYSNFVVAEVEEQPAAALSAFATDDPSFLPMHLALIAGFEAVGLDEAQVGEALGRMLVFMTCHVDDQPNAWVVEWVATLDSFRRRGLVRELLEFVLARGGEREHPLAQIGILIGNTSAQSAYESVGFALEFEKTSDEFEEAIGSPGLARLLRPY